ncbi:MAG: hypothetical protein U0V70_18850 [Terriglobia bacterium]
MTRSKPRNLLREELKVLNQFLCLEISLKDLRDKLVDVLEFDFEGDKPWLNGHFITPEPGIRVEKWHIENALDKKRLGLISERELEEWASVILMCLAYDIEENADHDLIADWLNDLGFNLRRSE